MSKIIDPNGFRNAAQFVMRPMDGNPIWDILKRIESHLNDKNDTFHFIYLEEGLELIGTLADDLLQSIYFFVMGDESKVSSLGNFKPYGAVLPDPLDKDMTSSDIIKKLGKPDKVGGGCSIQYLGYQRPWIKYYPRDNVQLRIEFESERIWRVYIGKAFD